MLLYDHTLVQHPTQCKSAGNGISVSRRNYTAIFLRLQLEFRNKHAAAHQFSPTRNAFEQLVRYGYDDGTHTLAGRFKRSCPFRCPLLTHLSKYTRPNRIHKLLGRRRNHLFFNRSLSTRQSIGFFLLVKPQRTHTYFTHIIWSNIWQQQNHLHPQNFTLFWLTQQLSPTHNATGRC